MAVRDIVPVPGASFEETLAAASPDLLREMIQGVGFLEHRRRAERALVTVVATSYLLGVSTRRVEKLAEGICCSPGRSEVLLL